MRVMVTGGSGFIGSHVVDKLRSRRIKVRVYDMVYPDFRNDIEYYQGSVLDFEALRMATSGVNVIMHLAAVADVKDVFEEPYYAEAINVRGTINVLEAARKSPKIEKVIYASTVWVYSDTEADLIDENTLLSPPSHLYTATKVAGEYYCQCYSKLYGLPFTILRYGIPYGPRAREGAVIPIFVEKALAGNPLTIAGDGSQYRKFVYVEDLAEGTVLSLKKIAENRVYNLEGNEKVSIKQIAEAIQRILGEVKVTHTQARVADFAGKNISNELAYKELGWKPKTSFEEGLRKYIEWYRNKLEQEQEEKPINL